MKYYTYEDFDYENLLTYAGLDCIVTTGVLSRLFPKLIEEPEIVTFDGQIQKKVKCPSILEVTANYEHRFHEFIIDMELNGIKFDVEENARLKARMEEELAELKASIVSCMGKEIDLDSDKDLKKYLYEELGLEAKRFTKHGAASVDAEAMEDLAKRYPQHGWLLDIGKYGDIISLYRTFVKDYVKDHVKSDGRIHPQYNLHGTSGFRITGDNPNLTQTPRGKHGHNIKAQFTVDEGYAFLTADFSSAEIKILGAMSQDPGILQAIKEGLDFHSFAAAKINGIPYEDFIRILDDKKSPLAKTYKNYRQGAKATGFGIIYGSTAAGIAAGLGITTQEGQALMDMYFSMFPLLKKFVSDCHNMALTNHMVTTPFGRRKMEFGTLPCFKYTAVWNAALRNAGNVRIQSPTSDIGLFCFSEINGRVKPFGGKTLCTVYDSIELQIPIPHLAEAIEILYYCMDDLPVQTFPWLTLPIGMEAEIGPNWGTLTEVHRGITQKEVEEILSDQSS